MNNQNDFDFVSKHLDGLDKNITLPDSLKSENLLKLIDDVDPVAAPPVQDKKVVPFFSKKGFAIAAMLVVAIGITIIYKSGHLFFGNDQLKVESAPAPRASEMPPQEFAGSAQQPEAAQNEMLMDESFAMDDGLESQPEQAQAKEALIEESAVASWNIEDNVMFYQNEELYTFPEGFEFRDSYSEGDLLIINGVIEKTNQSVITVFRMKPHSTPEFIDSIVNQGTTIYTMVYGELTIIISIENNKTFVNTYKGAEQQSSTEIQHSVATEDIIDSNSGFAIKLSNTTALIFGRTGKLLRDVEIEDGLTINNIIVEGDLAYLFLSNEETLTVPLT